MEHLASVLLLHCACALLIITMAIEVRVHARVVHNNEVAVEVVLGRAFTLARGWRAHVFALCVTSAAIGPLACRAPSTLQP